MKPGLLVFSPWPPLKNGIADYAARLLPFHAAEFDCAVVVDDANPEPSGLPPNVSVLRSTEYLRHKKELRTYRHLFHVGNNVDHVYMLPHLRDVSGLVVVHDLSLHHMVREAYVEGRPEAGRFVDCMWEAHGHSGRILALQDIKCGWRTQNNYVECDMRRAALGCAAGAITHSRLGMLRLRAENPGVPVRYIPHFADRPLQSRQFRRTEARRRLALEGSQKVLLSLGFVTNAKQLLQVMDALRIVARSKWESVCLIVAGQENDLSVMDEARKLEVHHLVRRVGYVKEADIGLYLDAADILLNLRYPTHGETSGSLCRALGHGVCSLVSNHGWYAELPDNAVVKIPPRPDVADIIAGNICALFASPAAQVRVEVAAQRYAALEMDIGKVALQYNAALLDAAPRDKEAARPCLQPIDPMPSLGRIKARMKMLPKKAIDGRSNQYFGTLWWSGGHLPLPTNGQPMAVSGPLSLKYAMRKLFGRRTMRFSKTSLPWGVYAGSWARLSTDGSCMARFSDQIQARGLALVNIWVLRPRDGSESHLITLPAVHDVLARFGFEVLSEIRLSAQLMRLIHYERLPLQEVAVLTRKRT